ncbi:hypothetical protein [Actinoplanes derwentensis]|uniref:hypothetical protein n=1 Tax=Actinoplanes derwentensis TaxID=113562 RepID=UPI0012FE5179|nr:hypothetical protein [Actinoplanes derwentensis]GID82021.1 hypothetical protein Ade03nite_09450 [Actinoplanes derwentensis]
MSGDGSQVRAAVDRAFGALGDRLLRRNVVADLFVVDGATMVLAYDAQRVTRRVGASFISHTVVLEEADNVAVAMTLPPSWLTEQAIRYVSGEQAPGLREAFDHPGLRVMTGIPEHVFVLKAFSAHTCDEMDLRSLAAIVGVTGVRAARQLCERCLPEEPLPIRSQALLEELFGLG